MLKEQELPHIPQDERPIVPSDDDQLEKLGYGKDEAKQASPEQVVSAVETIKQQGGSKEQAHQAVLDLFGLKSEGYFSTFSDEKRAFEQFGSNYAVLKEPDNSLVLKGPNIRSGNLSPIQYFVNNTWDLQPGHRTIYLGKLAEDISKAVDNYYQRMN